MNRLRKRVKARANDGRQIEPLRIQKGAPATSPGKMAGRALAELSPMERRRNSPSFNQQTKKPLLDSSPLETSPFASKFNTSPFGTTSPRAYWQGREPSPTRNAENRDPREGSPSMAKRASIENLKRASRVKNSNMFAREAKKEYDPLAAPVERPLAAGRPLSAQKQQAMTGTIPTKASPPSPLKDTPSFLKDDTLRPGQQSPGKSSLSKNSRYGQAFDPETGIWSEDDDSFNSRQLPPGKSLHRHAKSVTFDVKPPQVNEYEMTTPDPSSVASGSREGSYEEDDEDDEEYESFQREFYSAVPGEDSFDASLEDTDKTPVVLPEDWRFMSPDNANEELTARMDDPFDEHHKAGLPKDASPKRTDSVNSNGEKRPLPPLPPNGVGASPRRESAKSSFERTNLPTPPPAPVSKSELQSMIGSSMSLEDRLQLMMVQNTTKAPVAKSIADEQRERRLRRGANADRSPESKAAEQMTSEEPRMPPRISRESILRKVETTTLQGGYDLDPDTPLPSLDETPITSTEETLVIKEEEEETIDVFSVPELSEAQKYLDETNKPGFGLGSSESDQEPVTDDDGESHYSTDSKGGQAVQNENQPSYENAPTPRAAAAKPDERVSPVKRNPRISFPHFGPMMGEEDFGLSLSQYMTPMSSVNDPAKAEANFSRSVGADAARPQTPLKHHSLYDGSGYGNDEDYADPGTPESVIRRSITPPSEPEPEPEPIPDPLATIKAPGGKLKTRVSLAPADVKTMAQTRRQVSGESGKIPPVPERAHNRPSVIPEADSFMPENSFGEVEEDEQPIENGKLDKRRSSLVPLDVSMDDIEEDLSMGVGKEFDRLLEAKKKGYLMRQNTKVVVASSGSKESLETPATEEPQARGTRSAGNSPVKRQDSNTWTTEPWNGKVRRRSIRQSGGSPMKKMGGTAPPLPGMASNVTSGLDTVAENEVMQEIDEFDANGERGRLFVRVVGIKELEMPLPRNERTYFTLTLDNGLHCVTTAWLELGKNALIGQEFELVVLNDLEFQLTLGTKIEPPKATKAPDSPTKKNGSTFSRLFTSPKKRKEMELKEKEEAQKAAKLRESEARERKLNPSAWDLLHNVVGGDGSFARSYVCLKEHEEKAYGRPYTVDIPCFNEWTVNPTPSLPSAKNGRPGAPNAPQRKAPYKIGKLELQLLYVPKPKEATDDDMPKSMNGCVRELADAEKAKKVAFEGYLSQQGGDCPYWRRRLFRLDGPKLTAYHEYTHQPRATINLGKAAKLIDDKSSLMAKEVSGKGGSRRKSAFAEEEEGYMFVEEGFRMRFANGEVIDFYADSTAEKENWMKVLSEVVGKDHKSSMSWTDIVLKRERAASLKTAKADKATPNHVGMKSAPNTPAKNASAKPTTTKSGSRPSFSRPLSQQQVPTKSPSKQPARPASQQSTTRPASQQPPRPASQQASRPNTNKPLPAGGRMAATDRHKKTRSMVF